MPNSEFSKEHLFPVFLQPENLNILLIGSEKKLEEKLNFFLKNYHFKHLKIVSEKVTSEIIKTTKNTSFITVLEKKAEQNDFENTHLAFITNAEKEECDFLKSWALKHGVLIQFEENSVDSDFKKGTSVDKGQLQLAFYADHISPSLHERIKSAFSDIIPNEIDELLRNLILIQKNSKTEFRKKVSAINKFTKDVSKKKNYVDPYSELENTSKIVKTAQLKSNLYLGIIGVLVFLGIFVNLVHEFQLYPDIQLFLAKDHHIFLWMLLVGFLAEIVAGSMGMGYGIICTTVLLLLNVPPPIVSASIHSAESFTTAAGSISHFKLRNINMKLVKSLAPFAILGAIIGAILLTYFGEHYAHIVKPFISFYTLYLGGNILRKSLMNKDKLKAKRTKSNLPVLGIVGGFIDSFAGGGWGPLVTGSLIKDGRTPRYVVGSSTLAKFLLTITSAITFIFTIGIHHWNIVLGLLLGGVITAPFSAMLTARLPVKKMTIAISILVILMSIISIYKSLFL